MTELAATQSLNRSRWVALVVGIVAAIGCAFAAASSQSRHDFFNAYLFGYTFWLGITLGGMALVMLHNLTGGAWGQLIRRIGQSAAFVAPLMLVLVIPVLLGMHDLFPWARPEEVANTELLRHRAAYLNVPFFIVRVAAYFLAWIVLSIVIHRLALKVESTGNETTRSSLRGWSAAGLIVYLLTATHASYDWTMSRDTNFYSTTFGFIVTTGQTLCALAFAIIILAFILKTVTPPLAISAGISPHARPPVNPAENSSPNLLNDVGNILLTLVILWTYVSFMQLLVIWMGNSGEDNGYYLRRGLGQPGPWRWIGLALIVFHFLIPFFLLLFRATKKYLPTLVGVAALIFVMHIVEQYWLIRPDPDFKGPHFNLTWIDVVAPVAIGGFWLAAFFSILPANFAAGRLRIEEGRSHG